MEDAQGLKSTPAVELPTKVPPAPTADRYSSCGSRHDYESYIGPVRYDLGHDPWAYSNGMRRSSGYGCIKYSLEYEELHSAAQYVREWHSEELAARSGNP